MAALFDEIILDPNIFLGSDGKPSVSGSPEFTNTRIENPTSGVVKINVNNPDARERLTVDLVLLTADNLAYLLKIWRGGYGNAVGLRVQVPYDYTATAQPLGTALASTANQIFNLTKTYTRPGVSARQDVRRIVKPVVNTNLYDLGGAGGSVTLKEPNGSTDRVIEVPFVVTVGGASTGFTYTINNTTGVLRVSTTTASGIVAVTFQFDTPMRIANRGFPITKFDVASEASGVQLEEILPSELEID